MSRCYDDMNGWTLDTNRCKYHIPGTSVTWGGTIDHGDLSPWATGTTTSITSDKCGYYEILGTGTAYPLNLYVICTACAQGFKSTGAISIHLSYVNGGTAKMGVVDCELATDTLSPTAAPLCVDTDQSSNGDSQGDKCTKYTSR